MRVYLTVHLKSGDQLLHNTNGEEEAIEWLLKIIPERREQIAQIQVEKAQLNA